MVSMIENIVTREGLGDLLAEGVLRAAKKIGQGTEKYAMHVKGKELPLHDPRVKYDLALQYALSPSGADHVQADHSPIYAREGPALDKAHAFGIMEPVDPLDLSLEKVSWYIKSEKWRSAIGSMGYCMFLTPPSGTYTAEKIVELTRAITGWNVSLWELMNLGERSTTMARAFNIREGFTSSDDTVPERIFLVKYQPEPLPVMVHNIYNRDRDRCYKKQPDHRAPPHACSEKIKATVEKGNV